MSNTLGLSELVVCLGQLINSLQDGLFWGCSRMGGPFWPPLPKIRDTNLAMMKRSTVISYLRKIKKMYKSHNTPLGFCWHQHFFTRNHQILLHHEIHIYIGFWYIISISLNFSWVFSNCFNKHAYNFDDVSKNNFSRPS